MTFAGAALDLRGLEIDDARVRRRVGEEWLGRMQQEHLAVGAFALLAHELAILGCPAEILHLVTRASNDEVRHAEICRAVAERTLGKERVPRSFRGVPRVPRHESVSHAERTLYHVVEMCCLSETFTGIYFTEALAKTTHPGMRAVLQSLLEDEIDHGKVGWAYLSLRAKASDMRGLAAALPDMIDRVAGSVIDRAKQEPEPNEPALLALGSIGRDGCAAIYRRGLDEVIFPGFEALSIDVAPARKRIAERD